MCGIVGLYLKNPDLRPRLGAMFSPMLVEMSGRGPDSAGFAVYREDQSGLAKASLFDGDGHTDWPQLEIDLTAALGTAVTLCQLSSHTLVQAACPPAALRAGMCGALCHRAVTSGRAGRRGSSSDTCEQHDYYLRQSASGGRR